MARVYSGLLLLVTFGHRAPAQWRTSESPSESHNPLFLQVLSFILSIRVYKG